MSYRHIGYKTVVFGVTLGTTIALNFFTTTAAAIAQDICPNDSVPASTTTRKVQLPQFGVQVTIPENFHIMAREDGSVSILNPVEFNHIQCLKQGIPVMGTELESESFSLVDNPERLSALEFAKKFAKSYCQSGNPACSVSDTISSHTIDRIEVVILEASHGYEIAYAWYRLPDTGSLVSISAFTKADLFDLLSRIQLLEKCPDKYRNS